MAQYSGLLGKRVEVQYRAGDIYLPATATLVGDTGKSIFLEEQLFTNQTRKAFRWEIPYHSIVSIGECPELSTTPNEPAASPEPDPPALLRLKNRTGEV